MMSNASGIFKFCYQFTMESRMRQTFIAKLFALLFFKINHERTMPAVEGGFARKQKKEDLFQKRLRLIYDTVLEAKDASDKERDIVSIFMKLPSKKEYPDYYQVCLFVCLTPFFLESFG